MESDGRVRQLHLTVQVPADLTHEADEIRRLAEERFVRGLLEVCNRVVQEAFGRSALVYVRHMDVRWNVERSDLDSPSAQTRLGCELGQALVSHVLAMSRSSRVQPPRNANIVLFEGEAHQSAAYLSAALDGNDDAWFFADARRNPDLWETVCGAGRAMLREVLEWLIEIGTAERLVARLDEDSLRRAEAILPPDQWPEGLSAVARAAAPALRAEPNIPAQAAQQVKSPSAAEGPRGNDVEPASPERTSRVAGFRGESDEIRSEEEHFSTGSLDAPTTGSELLAGVMTAGAVRRAALPTVVGNQDLPVYGPDRVVPQGLVSAHPGAAALGPALGSTPGPIVIPIAEPARMIGRSDRPSTTNTVGGAAFDTRYAGLFYLSTIILEIDLAEHLYFAGVREERFVGHLAALLAGADDDPAPWLLAGSLQGQALPLEPVADWAASEIWDKARRSVFDRLRVRNLPVLLADELAEAIERLASPLVHAPSLAHHDAITCGLLVHAAALLAYVFLVRLGVPVCLDTIRAQMAIDGRIEVKKDELVVWMPMSAVDLAVRRAGLDFDPGFVPWLRRTVRFTFVGGESL